jgi:hypothetical protein
VRREEHGIREKKRSRSKWSDFAANLYRKGNIKE